MKKKLSLAVILILLVSLVFPGCSGDPSESGTADGPAPETLDAKAFIDWLGTGQRLRQAEEKEHTFRLTEDITLTQEVHLDGRSVTLNLDGHSISGGVIRAFTLTNGASLTLTGGSLSTKGDNSDGGVIRLTDSNLILDNMKVQNTDDSHISERRIGGVIYAMGENQGTVTLKGGTELSGSPSGLRRSGGTIAMAGKTTLIIEDATVQNGKAGTAGNILLEGNASLRLMPGSVVRGGEAIHTSEISGSGGNITGYALSEIHLEGGTITDGTADKAGGNVYLSNTAGENAGIHIYSGTVENGKAHTDGGNIYATEKFSLVRVYGGTLKNGVASRGGNIGLQTAELLLWGGTLTGTEEAEELLQGGNIYADTSDIEIHGGSVEKGLVQNCGGNIYVTNSNLNIYGGKITGGTLFAADIRYGGGNIYAGGASLFNLYGGEISGGVSNCNKNQEASAAGANVMIAGTTFMQMFDGLIKDGTVYGKVSRGGGVYVYGQVQSTNPVFHMYGGIIENGPLENTMRGFCVASYSATNNDTGVARARIFSGEIRFTGDANDKNKVYTIHGSKTNKTDVYLFDPEPYQGMYSRTTAKPCPDATHNTPAEGLAATCLTPGAEGFACETCGLWYRITGAPTGHTLTEEITEHGTLHSCSDCDAKWYTE